MKIQVSPIDKGLLGIVNWKITRYKRTYYAVKYEAGKYYFLHNLIMCPPAGMLVDHINGNGLDNRRENLRFCMPDQNKQNARKRLDNSTGFKGVTWNSKERRFYCRIGFEKKRIWIGSFTCATEAAKAYDKKAKELHGNFAVLNFSSEGRA